MGPDALIMKVNGIHENFDPVAQVKNKVLKCKP